MFRFKWRHDKIVAQRIFLLTIIGVISYGILRGHAIYEKEVSEYMRSMEYRRAKKASQDHYAIVMTTNQRLLSSDEDATPVPGQE